MLLELVLLFIGTIFFGLRYVYSYWSRRGFPNIKPSIPFGNLGSVVKKEKSFGMGIYDLYQSTTEPFIGIYLFFRPAILIRDPQLVKSIMTEDFSHFHDRGVYCNEKDPMSAHLFALKGTTWKNLRNKLTPTFTSGKLKSMFSTVLDVGNELNKYLDTCTNKNETIEMHELLTRYSLDIIASVIFGLEMNSIHDPDHEFMKLARVVSKPSFLQSIRPTASFVCPKILEFLQINALSERVRTFMVNIVTKTIEHREQNNVSRKDFMQLLLQLRNTGVVQEDGDWDLKSSSSDSKLLSIEECAAQVFIFFIAGTASSAATFSYCLYELTQNRKLMDKILEDIDTNLKNTDGKITYEAIMEMKYLDACVNETFRKYPGLPMLNRECTKEYQIPGSNYVIEKGMGVIISVMGLHKDPKNFPDPEKFIPQRFLDDVKTYNEKCFIPFGDGPRNCIAFRLGRMIVKAGLVQVLSKYNFESLEKKEIEFDSGTVGLIAKNGIHLKVLKRDVESM